MARGGGAALLLCAALFFLSTAPRPAVCFCPASISQFSCKGDAVDFNGLQPCGSTGFQCRNSNLSIRFGSVGRWYRVIKAEPIFNENGLEIEDPALSGFFARTHCDFLYSFPPPGPLFTPPQTSPDSLLDPHFPYCSNNSSDHGLLFSKLIKGHLKPGSCAAYDLYFTSEELRNLQRPALPEICLPGPGRPVFIWKLRMNNNSDGTFNIVSAGFSRRHRMFRSCFSRQKIVPACGTKRTKRNLITGLCAAVGVCILAGLLICLWRCRINEKMKKPSSTTLLSQAAFSEKDPEAGSAFYLTHVFKYEELHEATNGFSPSNELDHGGHGTVYKGTLPDGRPVAIKRLYENGCKRTEQFLNEIAILSRLRHQHLVALYGCTSRHSRELLLVYEFIPNGTIADHLHRHRAAEGALTWPLRLRIAVETAAVLAYLHATEPQIIHRDVKTSNILLDGDFRVKVGDFGLSRPFPVEASHVSTVPQGTPGYVDPEYHRCYQLTDKSDVYSFGVVLAELISSKPAVDVTRSQHEINLSDMALSKIQNAALQELVDPKLGFETNWEVRRSIERVAELAMRCLQGERDMRPTMEDALQVLQQTADDLCKAQKGGVADHLFGDAMVSKKNCAPASPHSVMAKWSSRATTPNTSG